MPIIGKLIKKTTEFSYRRNFNNKGKEYINQLQTLEKLLDKAKDTNFGKEYNFKITLQSKDPVSSFQKCIPIVDYDTFYEEWLKESIKGAKDHTWPGRIKHYALSSGTTGSPSKRIPVTDELIRSFQKTSLKQISTLHELDLPETFYTTRILTVGACTQLTKKDTHIEGDLSGILRKYTSMIVNPFTKPGTKISRIKDWNKKLDRMVEKAPEWNIGIIAGVPSWCIMLMERIVDHYKVDTIHDIWPNFQVYVHGGVFIQPYIPRLEKITGKKVYLLDTYLASEGYFAYQVSPESEGMQLLLNSGIFYEFIPFNADFFDESGNLRDKHDAFTLNEVEEGLDYAIVISTNAGLWRYMIGDLVRFVDVAEREIKITGRIKQYLSLCGEHLSLDNINTAIVDVAKEMEIELPEFCIYVDDELQRHEWFVGSSDKFSSDELMTKIDKKLSKLNDDYAAVRKYSLKDPQMRVVPVQTFYDFLESIGKSGSQNKFPRVMNTNQKEKWLKFLKKKHLIS